ncbi:MAG: OmpA family protein [Betaproteobacteria bacterium]|nr:OmpA family protein [Burkholderiales bacterium]MBA3775254.1 OmpA family protein [Betaproteobacteria bacterium]MDQ3195182.1 OmpA family protein [Pseudomonadota bacterium]
MSLTSKNILVATLAGMAVVAALAPVTAVAQEKEKVKTDAYLVDGRGELARSGFGLCWRTGYWTPAQAIEACDPDLVKKEPKAEPKPEPVPPPAEPAPIAPPEEPKPAPIKLLPQKINFSADALFDFDKAVLRPNGKTMLDDLASTLEGAEYDVILLVGHTDRIGSDAYNQKLSERRAAAAKQYLVGKGISADRIQTEGRGEKEPVTAGECKGKPGKALIQCLQPDRRVDVEVTGSKEVEQ